MSTLRAGRYSFLFEAEWTPGLLDADRRNRSLENVLCPYREWNPEPPVLWRSAAIAAPFASHWSNAWHIW
jgi:hypothetical protein